jgi:hypothetical protein
MSASGFGSHHLRIPLLVGSEKVVSGTNTIPDNIRFKPEIMFLSFLGAEI